MRILIVEPNAEIAARMQARFVEAHGACDTIDSGEDLERGVVDYDLVVIDVDDYPETLPRLRAAKITVPVIALARAAVNQQPKVRLQLFEQGADDVLCWPFLLRELVIRGQAIVRRANGHSGKVLTVGPLQIDPDERVAEVSGKRLHLTGKQFAVLEYLALRINRTVTQEQLMSHLYQLEEDEPSIKIIQVFICQLRRKLAAAGAVRPLIETTWGRGYIIRQQPPERCLPIAA